MQVMQRMMLSVLYVIAQLLVFGPFKHVQILSPILGALKVDSPESNLPDWRSPYIALQCLVLKSPEVRRMVQCAKINTAEVSPPKVKGFFLQPSKPTQTEYLRLVCFHDYSMFYYIHGFPQFASLKQPNHSPHVGADQVLRYPFASCNVEFLDWP